MICFISFHPQVHPIIWKVSNLPFDCQRIEAIEKPLGGVLVFAANSLIYLNQSTPPYGVSLNNMTDASTMFPLKIQENGEYCCFLSLSVAVHLGSICC